MQLMCNWLFTLVSHKNAYKQTDYQFGLSFIHWHKFVLVLCNLLTNYFMLNCPCQILAQMLWMNIIVHNFSFIHQWNMFVPIATNLQLMHYQIVLSCNYWILVMVLCFNLNLINVILNCNLSISWWNYFFN